MIAEIFWKSGVGRRLRELVSPTAGAKKINRELYSILHQGPTGAPSTVTPPVVSGSPAVGQVLTCTPGTYTGTPIPTITRQWRRNTTNLGGQTGLTYTVQPADSGQSISCVETATNALGSTTAASNVINVAVAAFAE